MNVIGPEDKGVDQQAVLSLAAPSGRVDLTINFFSRRGVLVTHANTDAMYDENGKQVYLEGRATMYGLSGAASDLVSDLSKIGFKLTAPILPRYIDVGVTVRHFHRATEHFSYDGVTGIVKIRPEGVDWLKKYIGNAGRFQIEVRGGDVASEFDVIYAPSQIEGRLVDASGKVITSLTGKRMVLEGGPSRFIDMTTVASDGTFKFPEVPVEAFSLGLRDTPMTVFASTVPVVYCAGEKLTVDVQVRFFKDLDKRLDSQGSAVTSRQAVTKREGCESQVRPLRKLPPGTRAGRRAAFSA